jgi:putative pyruvate formate lyase activating enzyme
VLEERKNQAYEVLNECRLCPRSCGVNRLKGEQGYCRSGREALISSAFPHFGEEPVLVGDNGSGTIFFANCNLRCVFCQNFDISSGGQGDRVSDKEISDRMLFLQSLGCHNINFVTPTHFVPQILGGVVDAAKRGLRIPLVYNCGGYEDENTLKLLDGVFDIYMPDVKFLSPSSAKRYLNAPDYPQVVKSAICEMHSQVGDLRCNPDGIAERGLIVRHLVMPNNLEDSWEVMEFIATHVSKNTYVNIMDQYRPMHEAWRYKEINRRIRSSEYYDVVDRARSVGLKRGF